MGRFFGHQDDRGCRSDRNRPGSRRTSIRRHPQCDELESRRLLSKSLAPAEGYLSPGADEVAKAHALISSVAGPAFQQYASDLQRLEASSNVTPRQFANLKKDVQQLATDIDTTSQMTGSLDPQAESEQFIMVQNAVDQAFLAGSYTKAEWRSLKTELANGLSSADITTNVPQQTVNAMRAIARAAHVTAADAQQLAADRQALVSALGAHAASTLGGQIVRDPVMVYYEGQVNQFVHKKR